MINSFDFDTKTVGHIVMKYDYLKPNLKKYKNQKKKKKKNYVYVDCGDIKQMYT